MVVFLTEIMPMSVRTTGFALAYSLATAVFGGFTPAISTYLIHFTGNRAVPGLWLSLDRKSTRLNSSHSQISYAVFCLKKKNMCKDASTRLAAELSSTYYLKQHA